MNLRNHNPFDGTPGMIGLFAIGVAVTGYFAISNLSTTLQATSSKGWKNVPCTITRSSYREEVRKRFKKYSDSRPDQFYSVYIPEIEYIYRDGGRRYKGDKFHITSFYFNSESEAKRYTREYARQVHTEAWMNPKKPAESCIVRPEPGDVVGTYFPLIGLIFCTGMMMSNVLLYRTS